MTPIERALNWILPILNNVEAPFHITGGLAAHLYGAKRPVNDIDIDLPSNFLDSISPELTKYTQFAPQRHRDTTWDLFVTTLDYEGQLIDLTGDMDAYVSNKLTGNWDPIAMNFDDVVWVAAFGHKLPLKNPKDLIDYKLKIKYDEQKHLADVDAIEGYIRNRMPNGGVAQLR